MIEGVFVMRYIHAGGFYSNGTTSLKEPAPENWLSNPMMWGWWELIGAMGGNKLTLDDARRNRLEGRRELITPLRMEFFHDHQGTSCSLRLGFGAKFLTLYPIYSRERP